MPVIAPEPLSVAVIAAPTKGAIPKPPVEPKETVIPPLGS